MQDDWYKWVFSGIGVYIFGLFSSLVWHRWRRSSELPSPHTKPSQDTECTAIVDIMELHDLWSDFQGTLYGWNPSWNTELSINPKAWDGIHVNRYTKNQIERVVYVVGKEKPGKEGRHSFYLTGLREFLNQFLSEHKELVSAVEKKLDVYLLDQLPSDLTFFVGERISDSRKVGVLLVNDEPLCTKETPTVAFVTTNERIVSKMLDMFHSSMNPDFRITLALLREST